MVGNSNDILNSNRNRKENNDLYSELFNNLMTLFSKSMRRDTDYLIISIAINMQVF
jgi:hypothetical protein